MLKVLIYTMFLTGFILYSQQEPVEKQKNLLGFSFGYGTQQAYPFKSKSYNFESRFYKMPLNFKISNKTKWEFAFNMEPTIYINRHLNLSNSSKDENNQINNFAIPTRSPITINEYVLNLGIQTRYYFYKSDCVYILVSTGPTFITQKTERLNKGLAFSDIIALGINYQTHFTIIDFRYSLRHVSNAGLSFPNKGFNSINLEIGFIFPF
jgi:hypothetical protein